MANEQFDVDITLRTRETGAQQSAAAVSRVLRDVRNEAAEASRASGALAGAFRTVDATAGQAARSNDRLGDAIKRIAARAAAREADALATAQRQVAEASRRAREEQERQNNALKQSRASFGALQSVVGAFGVTLSAQFAVSTITNFAKEVVGLGSKITDLSERMGVGVVAAQEIKFALDQTGSSADGGARAISQMNDRLTEGKKGTVAALKDLNLQIDAMRAMKPEDAFMAIAAAIKDVPDPMRQTQLAMELFGRSGVEILPAIKQGMSELRDEARRLGQVLSEEDVRALDDFGDRWDALMNRMKVSAAQATLDIVDAFKQSWWQILKDQASAASQMGPLAALVPGVSILPGLQRSGQRTDATAAQDRLQQLGTDVLRDRSGAAGERAAAAAAARERAAAIAEEGKAAERWGAQVKAALDKATGAEAQRGITLLRAAYAGLTADQKANGEIVRRLLEPYEALRRQVKALPAELERARDEFAPLPSRNLFTSSVTGMMQIVQVAPSLQDQLRQTRMGLANFSEQGLLPVAHSYTQVVRAIEVTGLKTQAVRADIAETKSRTVDFTSSLDNLARSFSQLAQIGGDSFSGIARQIAEVISLMSVGSQIGKQFRDTFYNPQKTLVGTDAKGNPVYKGGYDFSDFGGANGTQAQLAAYGNAVTTGVAGYGALMQATDVRGRGNRALRGGLTGMQIGGAMYPGYGHLIGFGVGALAGAVRNPAWEDVQDRVSGERWGFAPGQGISEDFARQIADQAKGQFKGDRATAEMFNFGGILESAGGPKQSNLTALSNQFRDVFSFLQQHKLTVEQTAEVIDQSWDRMAEAAMKKGGLLTDKLREMIDLNREFGTESAAIAAFVTNSLTSGVGKIAGALNIGNAAAAAAKDTTARDKIAANDAEMAALRGKEGGAGIEDEERIKRLALENADLAKQDEQRKQAEKVAGIAGISSEGAASATASAITGSFAMLQKQGMSLPDALNAVGPAVQALQQQLEATGFSGGAAFEDLQKKIALATDSVAGPGIAAMQQYASSIADLYNGGVLTSEMFGGMASQVAATREALMAQGVDGTAAMEMIKPQLQQMWEIAQKMPGAVDEATAKMLKEAEAAGIVGDKWKPAQERMADGIDRLGDLFERVFGKDLPAAAESGANAVNDALSRIPRDIVVKGRVEYETDGDPNEPQRRSGSSRTDGQGDDIPGAASGVWAPGGQGDLTWFGEGGEPELGGPRSFMAGVLADAIRMTGGLGGGGAIVIQPAPVYIGRTKLADIVFDALPRRMQDRGVR